VEWIHLQLRQAMILQITGFILCNSYFSQSHISKYLKKLCKLKLLLEFSMEPTKMFISCLLDMFFFKYFEIHHSFPFFPEANTNSKLESGFLIVLAKLINNSPKH
jgi:hypothetical protein